MMRAVLISLCWIATLVSGAKIRVVRSQTCAAMFSDVSSNHSACKPVNPYNLTDRGVSSADKQVIVDRHNYLRSNLEMYDQPPASDMMKLYWDDEIAMIAQRLADSCVYGHDENVNRNIPGRLTLGQNVAFGLVNWTSVINAWFDEEKYFEYGNGSTGGQVGHYTQVVWAKTTRIGCGFANCPKLGRLYVCNYGPAGNTLKIQNTPYKKGPKGSECPDSADVDGLCDCKTKICLNGAAMDPNTCGCTCTNRLWFRQPDCGLVCSDATDQSDCETKGGKRGHNDCFIYSNVPVDYCPFMCNQCPGGDIINQPEGGKSVPSSSTNSSLNGGSPESGSTNGGSPNGGSS